LGISIEAILQKEPDTVVADVSDTSDIPTVPIILLTRKVREGLIEQAIEQLEALNTITQPLIRIRVETL
jgi:homoserine dehydrogenase